MFEIAPLFTPMIESQVPRQFFQSAAVLVAQSSLSAIIGEFITGINKGANPDFLGHRLDFKA